MSIRAGRTDKEIEMENHEIARRAILHFAGRKFDHQIDEMSKPIKGQKREDVVGSSSCIHDPMPPKIRDPKPQYPPAVVWGCVILTIILFIWGFCRG